MKNIAGCLIVCMMLLSGCQRSASETWEDIKTAGHYMHRGFNALCGKDYDSCLIASDDEFLGPSEGDFIPLQESDLKNQFTITDVAYNQPLLTPGQEGSGLPAMHHFHSPSGELSAIFSLLHFETDNHILQERQDLLAVEKIVQYLKKHSNVYLNIEGHCDERASAAYNMALGTRRANHVRVLLIKQGIDFNRIYTISYGKERPLAKGHSPEDWRQNRRVEFKIFEKK